MTEKELDTIIEYHEKAIKELSIVRGGGWMNQERWMLVDTVKYLRELKSIMKMLKQMGMRW